MRKDNYKKILICGKNSYVGISARKYLEQWSEKYSVEELSIRGVQWKEFDFSKYDVVFYVAGIAHINSKKIMEEKKELYYQVNTILAEEVAKKSKESGVKQFIYMSSASVYGESAPIGKKKTIKKDTKLEPINIYGDSKLCAEIKLNKLADEKFKVVLLRPPMIYGVGCKGNYQELRKIALKLPVFPKVENSRSMIYIDNFAEFVKQIIDNGDDGVFCPADKDPISTCEMVKQIAKCHDKKVLFIPGFEWVLKLTSHFTPIINKAFGNMVYDKSICGGCDYCKYSTVEGVEKIEKYNC